ncbi:SDR family NAD(P)-dependent oxidoreductase [Pseudonocardia asaccharolytica]|uniref:Short-chain dehydrogenase n=1 Tax=Pseudonocardia asaccharolytica DSM 44247 = NBRC 16224 TaxID=1123024 RepID=A0A511D634_9PSEU|nr:SDR family NAD(P)-dependent oxidoreductase [Pseudonocardia asaccharolytica]GEL18398.1 short-chain dehydrogenase [Pseudonocardia asaccharolytica DSM 44247 = NBRC 16224]
MPIALITGGSSGIGTAFADQLAVEGHDLVLVARGRDQLEKAAARHRARHGVAVEPLVADLAEPVGRAAVEARLADPAAPVDVLVNNAGVEIRDEFAEAALPALQREIDVNITAVLRLTHAALPGMIERGRGSVITVSSFSGFLPPRGSSYGATKAWAIAFTDTIAASLQGTGVRMTALTPGYVRTNLVAEIHPDAAFRQGFLIMDAGRAVARCLADNRRGKVVSAPGIVYRMVSGFIELPRRTLRLGARVAGRGRTQHTIAGKNAVAGEPRAAGH